MPLSSPIDETRFQRLLRRHIVVPLAVGLVSALVFLALIAELMSTLGWVEHSQEVISRAHALTTLSVDLETGTRGFLLTGDDRYLEPYVVGRPRLAAGMASLAGEVRDNPDKLERLQRLQALQQQWIELAQARIDQRHRDPAADPAADAAAGRQLFDGMRREWAEFVRVEQRLRGERALAARRTTWTVSAGFAAVLLVIGGLLAWNGRRQALQLVATYGAALKRWQDSTADLQRQALLRDRQAALAAQLSGERPLAEIGALVLGQLAQATGAVVGALHAAGHGGLQTVGVHGLPPPHDAGAVSADAALLAQVVADGRPRTLDHVGSGHFRIATGFGSSAPDSVLLAPVTREGHVNGVIELGFHGAPGADAAALLAQVAETVGHAIAGAQYREELHRSLEETQRLNEELEVQQEELRSANESLGSQSQRLRESQADLEQQQAELEHTNQRLAEQAARLDRQNDALRDAQAELQARADALQRASRYKSEFLANMSHELRTPLNSILILARLLGENRGERLSDEQVRFAGTIYAAGNDLLALINDILDLAKVESGRLELDVAPLDVADVLAGLQAAFGPQAVDKGLSLTVQAEAAAPPRIETDRLRLEQVLRNLLSNAVKFTETGAVTLQARPADDGGIAFVVEDTGIGIAAEQQSRVFDAFYQADAGIARRFGGTGLGLAISRDLAGLLGGSLSLASTPGRGSRFVLTLPARTPAQATDGPAPTPADGAEPPALAPQRANAPLPPAAAPTAAPSPSPTAAPSFADDRDAAARGRTVLVIEDDPVFARTLYELAHDAGFSALVAHDAASGLALAASQRPQAVLLDVRLPDASGLAVLQRLKEDPQTRHLPVHVISGEDFSRVALPMGAIGYAVKPVSREAMQQVFQRLGDTLAQQHKRVLVVEDDERQRDSVVALIAGDDVEIDAVGRGEQALALLRERVYDCMVIDLVLPDMRGEELLERMTHDARGSFPPVIVYTGRVLTPEEEAALARYSRSIIVKGARSPERLLDEVTLFLHQVESRLSDAQQSLLRSARGRDEALEGRRLLLVDDDVRNIFALGGALEQHGLRVVVARHGEEALRKLEADPAIELVLMDVMMPVMDGLEATRRLRADPRWRKLPVIAITAKAMADDQAQCRAAGMDDYLAKPVDLDRLLSLLRVWLPGSFRA